MARTKIKFSTYSQALRHATLRAFGAKNPRDLKVQVFCDSCGDDNWRLQGDRFYVTATIISRVGSHKWTIWTQRHASEFGGLIHWAKGQQGINPHSYMVDKWCQLRNILSAHPWDYSSVSIIDKSRELPEPNEALRIELRSNADSLLFTGRNIDGTLNMLRAFAGDAGLSLRQMVKGVIINCPSGGHQIAKYIKAYLMQQGWHLVPLFTSTAGHPGIDLADGLAWAIGRYLRSSDTAALPWGVDENVPRSIALVCFRGAGEAFHARSLKDLALWANVPG